MVEKRHQIRIIFFVIDNKSSVYLLPLTTYHGIDRVRMPSGTVVLFINGNPMELA